MSDREPLLLLVHRVPYPPNKGDKIRSYHLLRFLAERYRVYLGAFADDPADLRHADVLAEWCGDVHLERLSALVSRSRMIRALLRGEPLSIASYRSGPMRRWVRRTVAATGAVRCIAFSAAMAQYVDELPREAHRVLDMVDVDSEKWRQYSTRHRGVMARVYRREARRLLDWERAAAGDHEAVTFVSEAETRLFRDRVPEAADRAWAVGNGVDCKYFAPGPGYPDPYDPAACPLVFTGVMDYWPNVDAVDWFAGQVLPRIRERLPAARLHVVGARPTAAVRALGARDGVEVVGAVEDMRPWLANARLVVAPLRVARGIQNKVLEGFAMAKPVLATSMALEGLELDGDYPLQADDPVEQARLACRVLQGGDHPDLGPRMRRWVEAHHDWQQRLAPFAELMRGATPGPAVASRRAADERVAVS